MLVKKKNAEYSLSIFIWKQDLNVLITKSNVKMARNIVIYEAMRHPRIEKFGDPWYKELNQLCIQNVKKEYINWTIRELKKWRLFQKWQ